MNRNISAVTRRILYSDEEMIGNENKDASLRGSGNGGPVLPAW